MLNRNCKDYISVINKSKTLIILRKYVSLQYTVAFHMYTLFTIDTCTYSK